MTHAMKMTAVLAAALLAFARAEQDCTKPFMWVEEEQSCVHAVRVVNDPAFGVFHTILGVLFTVCGAYCISVLQFVYQSKAGLKATTRNMSIGMVLFTCILRAVWLFIDPYNFRMKFSALMANLLMATPFPALTGAYGLMLLMVFDLYKASSSMKKMTDNAKRNKRWMLYSICAEFTVQIGTDTIRVLWFPDGNTATNVLLLICQTYIALWGLIMGVGFLYYGGKMYSIVSAMDAEKAKAASRRSSKSGNVKKAEAAATRYFYLAYGTASTMFVVFGVLLTWIFLTQFGTVNPTNFFAIHGLWRIGEFMLCAVMVICLTPGDYGSISSRAKGYKSAFSSRRSTRRASSAASSTANTGAASSTAASSVAPAVKELTVSNAPNAPSKANELSAVTPTRA